jgi:hypothetical protein
MTAAMNELTFVFGAHRSGTTVFKLMLDSHPEISNPGEVDFIFDYLKKNADTNEWTLDFERLRLDRIFQSYNLNVPHEKNGRLVVFNLVNQLRERTKKRPAFNLHRNLDKVGAFFPETKIIHIIRDPRDVARSCIAMGWAGTAYFGIDQWLKTESCWDDFASMFKKSKLMELSYEDLISNPEEQLKRVCSFIGVPFSLEMLTYPKSSAYEAPNPSAIKQWGKKLSARDVALVEMRVKDMLLKRHYELSGFPLDPPGVFEWLRLIWKNKTFVWRFGCRRFGYFNFLMEKVTRRFRPASPFHSIFVQRMNEIEKRYLK